MGCLGAAAHFGLGASRAIRWVQAWRAHGHVRAKPQGGERRSGRIEAHGEFLLERIAATPDARLAELQAMLKARGLTVGVGTVWRFFKRHDISPKKDRARSRAGAA